MKEDKKNRRFSNRIITVVFVAIACVPVLLLAVLLISGLFVIAYEEELYAKELDNPYVNCGFEGWHTEVTEHGSIILPEDWKLAVESKTMQILQDGESIAVGTLIKGKDTSFSSKEAFLSQILKTDVSKAHCDNLHSLLGSSFGKLYINENKEFQGYYLNLVNDNGSSLFFCFSSAEQKESELKSKAEAILYAHEYREEMRIATKYIYDANPFYVYWKKHFCPKCGEKLELRYISKIVNSKSSEAKDYDFSVGDTFFVGDVEFRTSFFHCASCHLDISFKEMKRYEKSNQK